MRRGSGIGGRRNSQARHQVGEGKPPERGERIERGKPLQIVLLDKIGETDKLQKLDVSDNLCFAFRHQLLAALLGRWVDALVDLEQQCSFGLTQVRFLAPSAERQEPLHK